MASSRRQDDERSGYGDARPGEQSTSWGITTLLAARFTPVARATVEIPSSQGYSGPRNQTNQANSHGNTSQRNALHRNPQPTLQETKTERYRRERNEAENARDLLLVKVEELKKEVEDREDLILSMKASTQRVLASTQEKELFIGPQAVDRKIEDEFVTLFKKVRTWCRHLGTSKTFIDVSAFKPGVISEFKFISPGLEQSTLEEILRNTSKRKFLAQGWIGLKMTKHLFSTLPDIHDIGNSVQDFWSPNGQARQHFHSLQSYLLDGTRPEIKLITNREFHDWRAYTASLMSRDTAPVDLSQDKEVLSLLSDVMDLLTGWSKGPTVYEEMRSELLETFKSTVALSKLLRIQRASWSVRYPSISLVTKSAITSSSYASRESIPLIAMFDKSTMKSVTPHDLEERTDNKYVEIITSPALYKRGNTDGEQFDTVAVMSPAAILWAEIEAPRTMSVADQSPVPPVPTRSYTGDVSRTTEYESNDKNQQSNPGASYPTLEHSDPIAGSLFSAPSQEPGAAEDLFNQQSDVLQNSIHSFVTVEHEDRDIGLEQGREILQPRWRRSPSPEKLEKRGNSPTSGPPPPPKEPVIVDAHHPSDSWVGSNGRNLDWQSSPRNLESRQAK